MCATAYRRLTDVSNASRDARRFTRAALTAVVDRAGSGVLDDTELVASELVANAVRAGARVIDIHVDVHRDHVEVAVVDDGTGWPTPRTPDAGDTSGRGLQIVTSLALSWGVTVPRDGRTIVWAQLGCDPGDTAHLDCRRRLTTVAP